MTKLTIDSVYIKGQIYPMLLHMENELPDEDSEFPCAIMQDHDGNKTIAADISGLLYAGTEETSKEQTFILARNRKTGKVRLIEAGYAVLKPVNSQNKYAYNDELQLNTTSIKETDSDNSNIVFESNKQIKIPGVNNKQTNGNYNKKNLTSIDNSKKPAPESNIYICNDCETVFEDMDSLIVHLRSHQYKDRGASRLKRKTTSNDDICRKSKENKNSDNCINNNEKGIKMINENISSLRNEKVEMKTYICDYCKRGYQRKPWFIAHIVSHQTVNKSKMVKNHSCITCYQEFAKKSDLINHEINEHESDIKYYSCPDCNFKTTTSSKLALHNMSAHVGIGMLNCEICNYETNYQSNLKKHILTHTQDRPFTCTICYTKFRQSAHLKKHIKTHNKSAPTVIKSIDTDNYICNNCGRSFKSKTLLIPHIQSHDKITKKTNTKNVCNACKSPFDTQSDLINHEVKMHGSKTPHKSCNICEFKTKYTCQLTIHMRTHFNVKGFKCSVCDYACQKSSDLNVHSRIHTGEKPFQCKLCNSKFAKKNTLNRHLLVHTGEKIHKCTHCDAQFKRLGGLQRHLIIHSKNKPYKCDTCSSCFNDGSALKRHLKSHSGVKPYKCTHCEYSCATNQDLKRHVKTHATHPTMVQINSDITR